MMRNYSFQYSFLALCFLVTNYGLLVTSCSAEETFTITTYYPSPYGSYREIRAQRMAIGDNYYNGGSYRWGTEINNNADLVVEGNVGIGTAIPDGKLAVIGDGSGRARIGPAGCGANYVGVGLNGAMSECANYSLLGGDNNTLINRPSGGSIYFRMNNSNQMVLNSSGNVGIGTTAPLQLLQVGALTDVSDGQIVVVKSNNGPNRAFRLGLDGNYNFSLGDYGFNGANIYSPYLTIRYDTGYVGIGRADPSYNLDVAGDVNGQRLCINGVCKDTWPSRGEGFYQSYYKPRHVGGGGCSTISGNITVNAPTAGRFVYGMATGRIKNNPGQDPWYGATLNWSVLTDGRSSYDDGRGRWYPVTEGNHTVNFMTCRSAGYEMNDTWFSIEFIPGTVSFPWGQ